MNFLKTEFSDVYFYYFSENGILCFFGIAFSIYTLHELRAIFSPKRLKCPENNLEPLYYLYYIPGNIYTCLLYCDICSTDLIYNRM